MKDIIFFVLVLASALPETRQYNPYRVAAVGVRLKRDRSRTATQKAAVSDSDSCFGVPLTAIDPETMEKASSKWISNIERCFSVGGNRGPNRKICSSRHRSSCCG